MSDFALDVDFPEVWDATMRREMASCPTKYLRRHIQHIVPDTRTNIHLHAGGAFAEGMAASRIAFYQDSCSADDSICQGIEAVIRYWGDYEPEPEGESKTLYRVVAAVVDYFREYPLGQDPAKPWISPEGRPGVEISFCFPVEGTSHPVTGRPILYTGRFDMIADWDGKLVGVDEKTTKQLGPTWGEKWHMRSQFTGYCWGARQMGYPVLGMLVRGISFLKDSYGHAQTITYRSDWMIQEWLSNLRFDIQRAISFWRAGFWPKNMDDSCTAFNRPCEYQRLCLSSNPSPIIPIYYKHHIWDPLKRDMED